MGQIGSETRTGSGLAYCFESAHGDRIRRPARSTFILSRLSIIFTSLVVFGASWSPLNAQSPSAEEVFHNLRAKFEETGVFSAHFEQTIEDSFEGSGQAQLLRGTIIAGRAGYRVEMADQTVVTDETTTWVYLKDERQVIINDYVEDDGSFSPNQFIGENAEEFSAEFENQSDPEHYVLRLTPKSADSYIDRATLWVRKRDYVVTRIDVVDVNGASIHFEMSNVDFHPDVSDDTFRMKIPEGVEVIDLRSE